MTRIVVISMCSSYGSAISAHGDFNYMNALNCLFVPYYLSVSSVNYDQKRTDRSSPRCCREGGTANLNFTFL